MNGQRMFEGRALMIVTKHEKERVMAPLLEKQLGVKCMVADIDTDQLGTFTGDIERTGSPIDTLRKKCALAFEKYDCDLAVASEGSFGHHPTIFFAPADDEFVMLIDRKNGLEIIARELTTETNFNGKEITSENELHDFAEAVKFPSHGLILRKEKEDTSSVHKGIVDWTALRKCYFHVRNDQGVAFVETDMRAMMNPTRMKVIEKATHKLVEKILSACPACNTPGFSVTDSRSGLPCEVCKFPTKSVLSHLFTCTACNFTQEKKFPYAKREEAPMFCDICNP